MHEKRKKEHWPQREGFMWENQTRVKTIDFNPLVSTCVTNSRNTTVSISHEWYVDNLPGTPLLVSKLFAILNSDFKLFTLRSPAPSSNMHVNKHYRHANLPSQSRFAFTDPRKITKMNLIFVNLSKSVQE